VRRATKDAQVARIVCGVMLCVFVCVLLVGLGVVGPGMILGRMDAVDLDFFFFFGSGTGRGDFWEGGKGGRVNGYDRVWN
jgi:hypothetical protein